MRGLLLLITLIVTVACSTKGKSQADCDKIANDIRASAQARGLAPQGICTNENPDVKKDFGAACQSLKDCNDDCCND